MAEVGIAERTHLTPNFTPPIPTPEWRAKGKTALKSSFFSSPSPLEAYGHYKKASECYKVLCLLPEEAMMRETSGECSMKCEHYSQAAADYKEAGKAWEDNGDAGKAGKAYEKAAEAWSWEVRATR